MENSASNRVLAAALGSILALALGTSSLGAAGRASAQKSGEVLKQIAAAYDRDDCDTVVTLGAPLIDARGGSGLSGELEAIAYEIVTFCETRKDLDERAYAHALRGTALDDSSDLLWRLRLALELQTDRHDAAVATVEAMSQGRGAALNTVPVRWMWQLDRSLKEGGKQGQRKRLLQVLAGDGYSPEEMYGDTDSFRLTYAELLAEQGDAVGAASLVRRLRSPSPLASASLDKRLRSFLPPDVDIRAAAEARLKRHREAMARHPDLLDPILETAMDLRRLGRPQDALQVLQTAAAAIDDPKGFSDRDDRLNWYWDALGRTYAMLGRYDDMVAAFEKGAALGEDGNPNVSQVINLAAYQNAFGRGEDALRTLAVFADHRESSPYGEMEMRLARGCAHAVAGRPDGAAEDLAFARAHEKDHPEALADLLLCLGDMDGAAAAFIRRLEDPDRRTDALMQLSDYDDPPVALPPHPVDSRLAALKTRPDVKAAIERAGGVRRFRLQRGEL